MIYRSQPHVILQARFVRMQQRKPVMQLKLKNILTHAVVEYSAKSGEKFEEADITRAAASFLYADKAGAHFMDQESFETLSVPKEDAETQIPYLKEGQLVSLLLFEGNPISIEMPVKVDLKVISTPPGVRGDTASGGATKPAKLETGTSVNVPLFVKEGDTVRVNTETGEYVERVN